MRHRPSFKWTKTLQLIATVVKLIFTCFLLSKVLHGCDGLMQRGTNVPTVKSERIESLTSIGINNSGILNRRRSLVRVAVLFKVVPSALVTFTVGDKLRIAEAAVPEILRQRAANVPGYGQPDVYYPNFFAGVWRAKRTFDLSSAPFVIDGGGDAAPFLEYDIRFITLENGKVVADRGFNQASYIRAAVNAGMDSFNGASVNPGPGAKKKESTVLQSVDWEASNPNVLTVTFADGHVQELRVTKRAFDYKEEGLAEGSDAIRTSIFFSSEYRRVTDIGERGIPSISGSRVLTKWKGLVGGNIIEAVELLYYDGVTGDPMSSGAVPPPDKTVVRSSLRLTRLGSSVP